MWTDVDRVEILSPLLPYNIPIDYDFLHRRDTRWWRPTVYFCLHGPLDRIWWEMLDSFHDNGHPDHVQGIDVDAVDLYSTCIQQQACDSSWFQWAVTVWMKVMLSLKVKLSSYADSVRAFFRPHPCIRWRCSLLRCLQRRGGWRLQTMRLWRIQEAQTKSVFFKFTALFVWRRMGLSDCEWVLKSQ